MTGSGRPAPDAAKEIATIYLDVSTHLVRRIDTRAVSDQGATVDDEELDVSTYEIVPLSAVRPDTFTFTPPPGTHVKSCLATETCAATPTGSQK
jgi:hypothetical protein